MTIFNCSGKQLRTGRFLKRVVSLKKDYGLPKGTYLVRIAAREE